jgi:uroporphyrinogen-III synthase
VSIGPVTSASLREAGIEPVAEADPHDVTGLARAVLEAAGRVPAW